MRKELRLRKTKDFKDIFKSGEIFRGAYFVLYRKNNSLTVSRLGVAISKSHFKLATIRNRLRRIAKEIFRLHVATKLKGYDFVLVSRLSPDGQNVKEAEKDLKNLMGKFKG